MILLMAHLLKFCLQFTLPSSSGLPQSYLTPFEQLAILNLYCAWGVISTVSTETYLPRFMYKNATLHVDGHIAVLEWVERDVQCDYLSENL